MRHLLVCTPRVCVRAVWTPCVLRHGLRAAVHEAGHQRPGLPDLPHASGQPDSGVRRVSASCCAAARPLLPSGAPFHCPLCVLLLLLTLLAALQHLRRHSN